MDHATFENEGTYTHPNLLAGDFARVTRKGTIEAGNNLVAGTVLGQITANSKLKAVDDSLVDGAEAPYAILAHDVDASAADAEAVIYRSGDFNEDALTFGGDDTIADHRAALEAINIYTTKNVGA